MELLFGESTDAEAVMWTYRDFRRAHPDVDTDEAMQVIGYQMLKMADYPAAVALLTVNVADHPHSSGAAFGLGRAYRETKQLAKARAEFEGALRWHSKNERARVALKEIGIGSGFGGNIKVTRKHYPQGVRFWPTIRIPPRLIFICEITSTASAR